MSMQARAHFYMLRAYSLSEAVTASVMRRKWIWIAGIAALLGFSHFFTLGINASKSLPETAYLVFKKDHDIKSGNYVSFHWHGGGPYKKGVSFTKIVRGVPGDEVTMQGRDVYINGVYISTAKPRATTGQILELGPVGKIPPGHFYVHAPNPDSLDSRYAITGWIAEEQIIGKAKPLF